MRTLVRLLAGAALSASAFLVATIWLAPASLMTIAVERASAGRLTLLAPRGSVRAGSGMLTSAGDAPRIALDWQLSPARFLAGELTGQYRLGGSAPIAFAARRGEIQLGAFDVTVPAALVGAALGDGGAFALRGAVRLRAPGATIARDASATVDIEWQRAASGLIDVAPLGSYRARVEVDRDNGRLELSSMEGPLRLAGGGHWRNGAAEVALTARVEGERAESLRAWLRTMGQEQRDGSFRFNWRSATDS